MFQRSFSNIHYVVLSVQYWTGRWEETGGSYNGSTNSTSCLTQPLHLSLFCRFARNSGQLSSTGVHLDQQTHLASIQYLVYKTVFTCKMIKMTMADSMHFTNSSTYLLTYLLTFCRPWMTLKGHYALCFLAKLVPKVFYWRSSGSTDTSGKHTVFDVLIPSSFQLFWYKVIGLPVVTYTPWVKKDDIKCFFRASSNIRQFSKFFRLYT